MMNKKSFFLGVVTGIVLTFAALFVIGLVNRKSADNAPVQYLEKPVSYENKKETSFKVFQVLGNAALAREASDRIGGDVMHLGNTVVILGENYYSACTRRSHRGIANYGGGGYSRRIWK